MKPDAALRAALYARVSTRDKGQEVDNQLIELRRFCVAQGWLIVREYRECESGGTARPAPSCRRCCAPRRSGYG